MVPLWMDNRHKPVWVDAQSAPTEPCSKTISETQSSRVQGPKGRVATEGLSEVRKCRKLCEDGILPHAVDAVELLVERGCQVPSDLFYRVLKRCVQNKDLALGKRIRTLIVKGGYKGNAFLATHLISFYASHRMLEEAMEVFTEVPKPDAYNWATIILAYAKQGEAAEAAKAIGLYRKMCESTVVKPDDRLYSAVLKACAAAKDLLAGKEVHAHVLKSSGKPDKFVQAGLVNMYAQCGSLEDARRVFDNVSERNVVTWTAMIAGYAQRGMGHEALSLYKSMQKEGLTVPNSVTYVCLLQACASIGVGALEEGKQLHAEVREHGLQGNVVLGGSLVNMYAKCGSVRDARALFDELPERNIVAWTAMIAGYAQQGMGEKALDLFKSMQQEGLIPNSVTYICLLQACASVGEGALDEGKELHGEIEKRGLQEDLVLGVTLVNMYAKCGSLDDARRLFDKLPERNTVAWSAMISGYAQKGMGREALSLYSDMQKEGLTPDSVTYVCLLQACTSIGVKALGDGKQLHAQIKEQGLEEDVVLGGSLVNMYAKCGDLEAARSVFELLPKRNLVAWNAMITGCAQQETGMCLLRCGSSS